MEFHFFLFRLNNIKKLDLIFISQLVQMLLVKELKNAILIFIIIITFMMTKKLWIVTHVCIYD